MPRKRRYTTGLIITKLRKADVLLCFLFYSDHHCIDKQKQAKINDFPGNSGG